MSYRKTNTLNSVDRWIILIYLVLVILGWFSIYGASYEYDNTSMFDLSGRAGMQMVWIGTSFILAFFLLMLDRDIYSIFAYFIYAFIILLLIATIFLAPEIKGSRSWLVLGPIRIQPAEFAKFAVALVVAKRFNSYNFKLLELKNFFSVSALIIIPMLLILMQKETGSALVYLAFLIVLYREGMSGSILFCGFCSIVFFIIGLKYSSVNWGETSVGEFVVLILILLVTLGMSYGKDIKSGRIMLFGYAVLFIALCVVSYFYPSIDLSIILYIGLGAIVCYLLFLSFKKWTKNYLITITFIVASVAFLYSVDVVFNDIMEPHQQMRIKVALGMENDPEGAGYNVNQSKIAIGSGGFLGKGFLNGTQTKLKYVPEQDTDFIFCTVGEEQGFFGSSIVLLLFATLIIRLIILAERQHEIFNRVYGYSVASILFFHLMINIGMVIGLTPVIGIPLPFFSYGGSSLWGFTILLFIFLKLDAGKKERY